MKKNIIRLNIFALLVVMLLTQGGSSKIDVPDDAAAVADAAVADAFAAVVADAVADTNAAGIPREQLFAYDIPVVLRPYYEQMRIKNPMPIEGGGEMLYPVGSENCYFIDENGDVVIPAGKYRTGEYIYDNNGVEKYLLCEKIRYYNPDAPDEDVVVTVFDRSDGTIVYVQAKDNHYDVIDFSGNVLHSFVCYGADTLDVGCYIVLEIAIKSEEYYGYIIDKWIVYDIENGRVYFECKWPVISPQADVFLVNVYDDDNSRYGRYKIEPSTGELTLIKENEYPPKDYDKRYLGDGKFIVAGKYYSDYDPPFFGYKNVYTHGWVYRDMYDRSDL
jgi:hypothetical protein